MLMEVVLQVLLRPILDRSMSGVLVHDDMKFLIRDLFRFLFQHGQVFKYVSSVSAVVIIRKYRQIKDVPNSSIDRKLEPRAGVDRHFDGCVAE